MHLPMLVVVPHSVMLCCQLELHVQHQQRTVPYDVFAIDRRSMPVRARHVCAQSANKQLRNAMQREVQLHRKREMRERLSMHVQRRRSVVPANMRVLFGRWQLQRAEHVPVGFQVERLHQAMQLPFHQRSLRGGCYLCVVRLESYAVLPAAMRLPLHIRRILQRRLHLHVGRRQHPMHGFLL